MKKFWFKKEFHFVDWTFMVLFCGLYVFHRSDFAHFLSYCGWLVYWMFIRPLLPKIK